jgi:predicted RNase H-like HicB family nuclease
MPNFTNLKVNILLQEKEGGGAIASLLEMPSCRVEAATREQAIAELQALMSQRLEKSEIIPVEITVFHAEPSENPWVKFSGVFKDDPDFALIADAIRAERFSDDETEIDPAVYLSALVPLGGIKL